MTRVVRSGLRQSGARQNGYGLRWGAHDHGTCVGSGYN